MDSGEPWPANIARWEANLAKYAAADVPEWKVSHDDDPYYGSPVRPTFAMGDMLETAKALSLAGRRPALHVFSDWDQFGGRVWMGANAQEEEVFRRSSLACPGLKEAVKGVFPMKPGTCLTIMGELDDVPLLFLLCPAPFQTGLSATADQMRIQTRALYRAAEDWASTDLVTGAWGCGAYFGDPRVIAPVMVSEGTMVPTHFLFKSAQLKAVFEGAPCLTGSSSHACQ